MAAARAAAGAGTKRKHVAGGELCLRLLSSNRLCLLRVSDSIDPMDPNPETAHEARRGVTGDLLSFANSFAVFVAQGVRVRGMLATTRRQAPFRRRRRHSILC